MRRGRLCAAALCLGLCAAGAQGGPLTVEAAHGAERLTSGFADWRTSELLASWRSPAGWTGSAALRRTERFELNDTQWGGGLAWPLAPQWRAEAELDLSDTHRVLPAWRWRSRAWREGVAGWNLALGGGRTLYRGATGAQGTRTAELQAERYGADWRFAWAGSATRLDGGGVGSVHLWRVDAYRSERLTLGALLGFGRELENVPQLGVVASSVRSAALKMQYAATPNWSLSAELTSHRQGDRYERNGWRLGLRYRD
jgi:YaiO family outer membrane protein